MQTVTLKVSGMTCGGCVKSVTRVLAGAAGVQRADVSLEEAEATVVFDEKITNVDALIEAIEDAGYDAAK